LLQFFVGKLDKQINPKKKIWEAVAPDLKADENGVATYKGCPFTIAGGPWLPKLSY